MSKRTFYVFIALIIVVIAGLGWYFFGPKPTPSSSTNSTSTTDGTNLFPFGQGSVATSTKPGTGSIGAADNTNTDTVIDLSAGAAAPRLRQVWKDQTAGATFVSSGSTTVGIRFVDRGTGHIYGSPIDAVGQTKLSNVTIPQIYEALWAADGQSLVMRYLKEDSSLQTFYAALSPEAPTIEGYFLPASIREIALLGGKLMYFDPTAADGALVQSNIDGSKKAAVASLDTSDWLISWNNAKSALITTKPSGSVAGYAFLLDTGTGALTKIGNAINGLTATLAPSGEVAFLSAAQSGGIASASYSVSKRAAATISLNTLSDKCAWSNMSKNVIYCAIPATVPTGTYPDDWYKGIVSFNDRLWKIDMVSGETDLISDLDFDAEADMDMMKLSLDKTDSYILFTNKKDMSLWTYKLQ